MTTITENVFTVAERAVGEFEMQMKKYHSLAFQMRGRTTTRNRMTKLQPAAVTPEEIEATANSILKQWEAGNPTLRAMMPGISRRGDALAHIRTICHAEHSGVQYYLNDVYQVAMRPLGDMMVHLSIKRIDRQPCHDWRDLQAIKNQLVGDECEGAELYPAESRRVDSANQYHIWCVKDPTFRFPFGYNVRAVDDQTSVGKSVNRKLK